MPAVRHLPSVDHAPSRSMLAGRSRSRFGRGRSSAGGSVTESSPRRVTRPRVGHWRYSTACPAPPAAPGAASRSAGPRGLQMRRASRSAATRAKKPRGVFRHHRLEHRPVSARRSPGRPPCSDRDPKRADVGPGPPAPADATDEAATAPGERRGSGERAGPASARVRPHTASWRYEASTGKDGETAGGRQQWTGA